MFFQLSAVRPDILQLLQAEPQLSTFSLPHKALRPTDVVPLFRALQCHDKLVKLSLPGNRLGNTGLQHLASAMTSLPSLAVLHLQANGIGAAGLKFITDVLSAGESGPNGANQVRPLSIMCVYVSVRACVSVGA